jgi:hypothetical protein
MSTTQVLSSTEFLAGQLRGRYAAPSVRQAIEVMPVRDLMAFGELLGRLRQRFKRPSERRSLPILEMGELHRETIEFQEPETVVRSS